MMLKLKIRKSCCRFSTNVANAKMNEANSASNSFSEMTKLNKAMNSKKKIKSRECIESNNKRRHHLIINEIQNRESSVNRLKEVDGFILYVLAIDNFTITFLK